MLLYWITFHNGLQNARLFTINTARAVRFVLTSFAVAEIATIPFYSKIWRQSVKKSLKICLRIIISSVYTATQVIDRIAFHIKHLHNRFCCIDIMWTVPSIRYEKRYVSDMYNNQAQNQVTESFNVHNIWNLFRNLGQNIFLINFLFKMSADISFKSLSSTQQLCMKPFFISRAEKMGISNRSYFATNFCFP